MSCPGGQGKLPGCARACVCARHRSCLSDTGDRTGGELTSVIRTTCALIYLEMFKRYIHQFQNLKLSGILRSGQKCDSFKTQHLLGCLDRHLLRVLSHGQHSSDAGRFDNQGPRFFHLVMKKKEPRNECLL